MEPELPSRYGGAATVVGQGVYNCAIHLHSSDTLLRISAIDKNDETDSRRMLYRADAMLAEFTKHKSKLGPSLLRLVTGGELLTAANTTPQVKEWVMSLRCINQLGDFWEVWDNYDMYAQEIEYCRLGNLYKYGETRAKQPKEDAWFAFALIWYFYVAQSKFGFRHMDLKPDNIVVRDYDRPHNFHFSLRGGADFSFESSRVPVVIDYDFGSFYASALDTRTQTGTLEFMPYEQNARTIMDEMKKSGFMVNEAAANRFAVGGFNDFNSIDWYSIGTTLLRFWTQPPDARGSKWFSSFGVEATLLVQEFGLPSIYKATNAMMAPMKAFAFHVVVAHEFKPEDSKKMFTRNESYELVLGTATAKYIQGEIQRHIPDPARRQLLAQLLSPVPAARHFFGEPYRFLTEMPLFAPMMSGNGAGDGAAVAVAPLHEYSYGMHPILDRTLDEDPRAYELKRRTELVPNIEEEMQ